MGINGTRSWTAEEDAIVLKMKATAASKRLKGRTRAACNTRRNSLRNQEPKPMNAAGPGARWTAEECKILRARYSTAKRTSDLMAFLPRFTPFQIRSKARHMGLRREFFGDSDVPIVGHIELIDQIRLRAKQDGIPLCKIDGLLKTGRYFMENWRRQRKVNLRAVARAIEFFGGTLVI